MAHSTLNFIIVYFTFFDFIHLRFTFLGITIVEVILFDLNGYITENETLKMDFEMNF